MAAAEQCEWRERVARRDQSGLSRSEFARREGVNPRTLSWWRWWLGKQPAPQRPVVPLIELVPLPGFTSRTVAPAASSGLAVRVGGYCVEVCGDFDGVALGRLLDVLEARR